MVFFFDDFVSRNHTWIFAHLSNLRFGKRSGVTTKYHNTHKINRINVKLEVKILTIADTPETLLTLSNTKVLNKVQADRLSKKKMDEQLETYKRKKYN